MQQIVKILGLVLVAITIVACDANLNINVEDGELVVNSSFSLTEQLLNSSDGGTALDFNNVELLTNPSFDIQDGQMVISGDLLCEDDSRQSGSITMTMGTTDTGFIDVQISDVTSDCDVPSSLIEQAQTELANGLAEAAQELEDSDATINFTDVTLADDALSVSFEVRAPFQN